MFNQPPAIQFELPGWIGAYTQGISPMQAVNDRMSFVIEASRRNVSEQTGGPFAAAIFERDSGKLVSLGVNLVMTERLSILHAEMVAFSLAQRKLNTYDLGADCLLVHELVTSTEPCAMCFGAICWSGVRRLVIGARDEDARAIGFDEGPKMAERWIELQQRGIDVVHDIQREKAAAVLSEYLLAGGGIYNSRQRKLE
ncbi:MAG: tRNA-specific adenosine deaminase [Gammaproteobacteria bacterium RIFOXYA12_FULL_61_12]|nr:MAG: tRNA-specific adenosine deaminase [Gammaproteobacteria bacterium RIFOXYD12_FULL_61_37]OGT94480.1 MAG: tRNA-specific adenosine deaminase [Gammaproteobacteria bacterium RIFOXYA12_FULL_61_12]